MNPIDLYVKQRCNPCDKEEKCGYVKREHCAIISMALDSDRLRELKEIQIDHEMPFAEYSEKIERYERNRAGS